MGGVDLLLEFSLVKWGVKMERESRGRAASTNKVRAIVAIGI